MAERASRGPTETLIGTAVRPIFPFFLMKFEQSEAAQETLTISMKVRADLYNYIRAIYGRDEVAFYLDPLNGEMRVWTPAMHSSYEMLQRLGLMSGLRMWIQNARAHLAQVVASLRT